MIHKAGKKKISASGNVPDIIDLGERIGKKLDKTIGEKIRAAGLRTEVGKSKSGNVKAGAFGGYRPGMFGGYRPWYSRFGNPKLGQDAVAYTAARNQFSLIPASLQTVKTSQVLTGLGLGLLGNRALVYLTPMAWKNDSKVLHEGLAFVAGLLPLLFKRNATTLGAASVGGVMFGAALLDQVINAVMPARNLTLKGGEGAARVDAVGQARQKLAAISQRMSVAQQPQRQNVPRVVAQPQYAS